jgi:hypothetical protein
MRYVTIYLSDEEEQKVEKLASKFGLTIGRLIKFILKLELSQGIGGNNDKE